MSPEEDGNGLLPKVARDNLKTSSRISSNLSFSGQARTRLSVKNHLRCGSGLLKLGLSAYNDTRNADMATVIAIRMWT